MKIKRRELLQTASLTLSGLTLAGTQAFAAETTNAEKQKNKSSTYQMRNTGESRKLAQFVVETRFEDLTPTAVIMAKRSIMDGIGVSLAASGLDPTCHPFVEQAIALQGRPECSIFGRKEKVPAELAAFANGAMAHALDYEDAHEASRTHPNAASIPAALAVAESLDTVNGREFITAIAVGCDIACRLILAGDPEDNGGRKDGFYPPAIVGAFSAAAAVARLLNLNEDQTLDAFSLTLSRSSLSAELIDSPLSHLRAVRECFGAQTAVSSGQLAQRGVKGFERPFEGRSGYYNMFGSGYFDPEKLAGKLGESFYGETISFKAWPACRASHAYIQAVQKLKQESAIDVKAIDNIRVTISPLDEMLVEPAASRKSPKTIIDAKFSLPFTVAAAFLHENVTLDSFTPRTLQDAGLLALADRVSYRIDAQQARVTSDGGGDLVEVQMNDGTVHKQGIERLYGSPAYPMSETALVAKFLDCASQAAISLPRPRLQEMATRLMALEKEENVGKIMSTLVAG